MDSIEACYEVKKYGESHAPDIAKQASKRYYGRLVRGFSLYSLQGDAINAGVVFKKIKQERWKALNSNAVALTTKIAFVLSYLGKPAFTQIAKFTQKLSNLREI
jgi:hypothetical protein